MRRGERVDGADVDGIGYIDISSLKVKPKVKCDTMPDSRDGTFLQVSAKRWTLGCVKPASWLPLAAGRGSRNLGPAFWPIPVYSVMRNW